jgi:hypothetical protein
MMMLITVPAPGVPVVSLVSVKALRNPQLVTIGGICAADWCGGKNQGAELIVPTVKTKLGFQHHHLNNFAILRLKSM